MKAMNAVAWVGLLLLLLAPVGCSGKRNDQPKAGSDATKAVTEGIPTAAANQSQAPPGAPGAKPGAVTK